MYTYTKRCRRFVFGGNELLRFSSSTPVFERHMSITSFYESIAHNCEAWCETVLLPRITEEMPKTDMNFRRQLYSFDSEVTYVSDESICILSRISLSYSKSRILYRFEDAQIWQRNTESLVPPKQALISAARELGVKVPKFSSEYEAVMMTEKNISALTAGEWVKINIEN